MTTWLITDLDDTWVKTARKITHHSQCLNVIAEEASYEPTYLQPAAFKLWTLFQNIHVPTLPVTGRSWASASSWRIEGHMPWKYGGILSHGACIKDLNGKTDEFWKNFVHETVNHPSYQEALAQWHYKIEKHWNHPPEQRVMALYTEEQELLGWVIKAKSLAAEQQLKAYQAEWTHQAHVLGLQVFHQTNHLTVMPHGISKAAAFTYWKSIYPDPEDCFIGFGDALQDVQFMGLCDWWMTPAKSDISTFLHACAAQAPSSMHSLPNQTYSK